jgi:hypothetical protein
MVFWITIGPAITRLLGRDAPAEAYPMAITALETIFHRPEYKFEDHQYWLSMLREVRLAFGPSVTRQKIYEQIQALPTSEFALRLLLYLAVSRTSNTTLEECCGAQTVAFELLLRFSPFSKLMVRDFSGYVLRYWNQVSKTQRFALQSPQAFRKAVAAIQEPSISNVASLLLLAADATGAHFSEELRGRLLQTGKKQAD